MEKPNNNDRARSVATIIAPLESSFEESDREQAQIRLALPALALLWAGQHPLDSHATPYLTIDLHVLVAASYLVVSLIVFFIWQVVYKFSPGYARLFRSICLVSDISAISAFTAVSDSAAVVLLPIYLSAIVGYGMRFGRGHLLGALCLSLVEFLIVVHINKYLSASSPLVITYLVSIVFLPIYTLILLQKYSLVLAAYISTTREREDFIDIMSHEIRAPLQSIISLTELSQLRLRNSFPGSLSLSSLQTSLRDILRCAERMLAVANRVTAERNMSNAYGFSEGARFNLFRDIFLSARICAVYAARKGLRFHWSVSANTPCLTSINSSVIQEILINLIDNSIKNTETGFVALSVDARRNADLTGVLVISINDTGLGIPSELGEDSRLDSRRESLVSRKNAGLGLGITKRDVARLSGSLEHQPWVPTGTQFTVRLPYTTGQYAPPHELSWIRIALISDRALSDLEESALIAARLFPLFVTSNYPLVEIAAFESVRFCVCLADQMEILQHLEAQPVWLLLNSLPLILLGAPTQAESVLEVPSVNCRIELRQEEDSFGQLSRFRMFTEGDFLTAPKHAESRRSAGSILLVDDSELTVDAMQRILETSGYECIVATTAESALNALRFSRFDLIIADRYIGEIDFTEVLRRERITIRYNLRVILLSADGNGPNTIDADKLAIDHIFAKPLSSIQLLETVRQLLGELGNQNSCETVGLDASQIEWEILDEIFGTVIDPERGRQLLRKFEDEILSDCVRCLSRLLEGRFIELAIFLHRMSGVASLFGARDLACELGDIRATVIRGRLGQPAVKSIEGLDAIVHRFAELCRDRYPTL